MTAVLPAPATRPVPPAPARPAGHRAPRPAGRARRVLVHTPGKLWALGLGLVLLSLAWGGFGGWVASQHSTAADAVATQNARLTFDARSMYQSIADADATITAAFLASSTPPQNQLQRYQKAFATAHGDLSGLQGAEHSPVLGRDLATLAQGLADYNGYVNLARGEYADGHPLTGGSFLTVASGVAHLTLLPAARDVFIRENDELNAANGQATELVTLIGLLVLALVTGLCLYWAQRWLQRRTSRVFSPGLVLASIGLLASVLWVLVAFFGARSDLDRGITHGSGPAQSLAQASIGVQQIRGDSVLNVISRTGTPSFADDFGKTKGMVDAWLRDAAGAQLGTGQGAGGNGSALVAAARHDTAAWYAANSQVYLADNQADYAKERALVVGGIPGNTLTGYNALEKELSQAIAADQEIFTSAASSGARALDPLTGVVAAASLVMAAGCAWAISRRLAEYR